MLAATLARFDVGNLLWRRRTHKLVMSIGPTGGRKFGLDATDKAPTIQFARKGFDPRALKVRTKQLTKEFALENAKAIAGRVPTQASNGLVFEDLVEAFRKGDKLGNGLLDWVGYDCRGRLVDWFELLAAFGGRL